MNRGQRTQALQRAGAFCARADDGTAIAYNGMHDSWSFRLGGGAVVPVGDRTLHLRAGVAWDTSSAPDDWARVDVDTGARATFAAGAGLEGDGWRVDAGGAWVHAVTRTAIDEPVGDTTDPTARVQPDIAVPLYPADEQPYHPFNAGRISAEYLIVDVALSLWWR